MKKGSKKQFCKYGHDTFVVGRRDGNCCKCIEEHNKEKRKTPVGKKQFCIRGHDTFICGRTKDRCCKECKKANGKYDKTFYVEHRDRILVEQKKYQQNNREARLRYKQLWYEANKERILKMREEYYENNKAEIRIKMSTPENKRIKKQKKLKKQFSITLKDFNKILLDQNFACAICKKSEEEILKLKYNKSFCVDHDHACCPGSKSCGKCVRGLLCGNCNLALGIFMDSKKSLLNAVNYLIKYEEKEKENQCQ